MRASPKVDTGRGPDLSNRQHICLQHYISCFFFIFCSNDSSIHSEGGLEVPASEYQNRAAPSVKPEADSKKEGREGTWEN